MKTKKQAIAVEHSAYRVGLWMLITLVFLIVPTSCAKAAEPQASETLQGNFGLNQEEPPTGTLEVIEVDLNAIEIALPIRAAAESCKKLASPLLQVVESANPVQTAQALGLAVRENQVQVSLVVDGSSTDFLERAGIDVASQVGQEIQAFVPIPRLCELATDERVLVIRPASLAETQ